LFNKKKKVREHDIGRKAPQTQTPVANCLRPFRALAFCQQAEALVRRFDDS
jgi:hypothetical protein